jgi:RimJ/RimL family protein N-acetyltransferase
MQTTMIIETPHLFVRYLTLEDFGLLYRLTGDPESMLYVGDGKPLSVDDTHRWITVSEANYAAHGYGSFAVVEKASGLFAGYAGFVRSADVIPPDEAELIYAMLPEYRGHGLASEVAAALVDHGFVAFGLRRILATVDPLNAPSIRVIEKLGFVLSETRPDEFGLQTHYFWRERAG